MAIRGRVIYAKLDRLSPITVLLPRDKKTKVYISHDIHIKMLAQEAVAHVSFLKDKDALSNLTAHSIRVETYVILYLLNKNTSFIQFRLRWRSDTFKMYLRNVAVLIVQHCEARQEKLDNLVYKN